jgi:glycosyltransferase involved in cell wall biosynthesis
MRILLLSQFYHPIVGGEERHVRNLAVALLQRGHQVSVVTLWFPGADAYALDGEIRVHRIRGTLQRLPGLFAESERRHAPPFPDPELVGALRRVLVQEKPEVVHAHNWLLASFLPLKPWCDAGLVVTLHDYGLVCAKKNMMHGREVCGEPGLWKCPSCAGAHYGAAKGVVTALGNFVSGALARRAVDRFIAVSHAVARHTGLARGDAPFEVIPNFVPDDVGCLGAATDPCLQDLPGDGYILFVGDLMHLKGVDVLLSAYATLERAPPLVLIGRRCHDTPTQRPRNVHFFGPWPHAAIMHAWRRCIFGVAPSVGPEACATVVMEAMASGKPVIATKIGGMPDLVDTGVTGLLVPPGDPAALARSIQRLLAQPEVVARMGTASLARVERLKAGSVVARIEGVYRDVLREKRANGGAGRGKWASRGATGQEPCGN